MGYIEEREREKKAKVLFWWSLLAGRRRGGGAGDRAWRASEKAVNAVKTTVR